MLYRDDIFLQQLRRKHLMHQAEKARLVQSLSEQPCPTIHCQIAAWTGRRLAALGRYLHKFSQDWEHKGNPVYNDGNIR